MSFSRIILAGAVAALAFAAPASASPTTTWNLYANCTWSGHSKCIGDGSSANGVKGNIYSFKGYQGGSLKSNVSINAEAYRIGNGQSAFSSQLKKDFLGYYSGANYGLGVENTTAPEHATDNNQGWDFVVFQLPAGSDFNKLDIKLSPWGTTRNMNATVIYGSTANAASLGITGVASFQNKTVDQLLAGGFMSMTFTGLWNASTIQTVSVTSTSPINYLIVAANLTPIRNEVDNFKVNAIVGSTVTRTPEPASLAAFGAGLVGLGGIAVRRRRMPRA